MPVISSLGAVDVRFLPSGECGIRLICRSDETSVALISSTWSCRCVSASRVCPFISKKNKKCVRVCGHACAACKTNNTKAMHMHVCIHTKCICIHVYMHAVLHAAFIHTCRQEIHTHTHARTQYMCPYANTHAYIPDFQNEGALNEILRVATASSPTRRRDNKNQDPKQIRKLVFHCLCTYIHTCIYTYTHTHI